MEALVLEPAGNHVEEPVLQHVFQLARVHVMQPVEAPVVQHVAIPVQKPVKDILARMERLVKTPVMEAVHVKDIPHVNQHVNKPVDIRVQSPVKDFHVPMVKLVTIVVVDLVRIWIFKPAKQLVKILVKDQPVKEPAILPVRIPVALLHLNVTPVMNVEMVKKFGCVLTNSIFSYRPVHRQGLLHGKLQVALPHQERVNNSLHIGMNLVFIRLRHTGLMVTVKILQFLR